MNLKKHIKSKIFNIISNITYDNNDKAFVIGGFVRDILLNRPNNDIDIVLEKDGIKIAELVSESLPKKPKMVIYKTYGTAAFKYNKYDYEFVGARNESYTAESRNPSVSPGTLEDDQKRRDFTINSLAISLNKENFGELIDPFGGVSDLNNRIIKTPQNPETTFSDDPLRMLRAIRFASQLNFNIEENTFNAIIKKSERISIITTERIVVEINKILLTNKPSVGFLLLEKSGLLKYILPELVALKGIDEYEGKKHKDNFLHTLEVVDNISKSTDNLWLRWAALLHDIGKAKTKRVNNKNGWSFHNHEYIGSKMVFKIFKRLKLPLNQPLKYVSKLVLLSSRPIALVSDEVSDSALRRLLFEANDLLDDLFLLCKADITTKNKEKLKKYQNNFKTVEKKIIEIEEKDKIRNFQPPITGEVILNTFDIKPGREVGIIKETIKEAILEGDLENNYEKAYIFMLNIGNKLNLPLKN